jgi:DNA-nicking Smr family endonuclease
VGHRRTEDEGDDALFLAEVAGTTPLTDRVRVPPPEPAARVRTRPATRDGLTFDGSAERPTARAAGVNRATIKDLAAGRIPPDASLDLHGLTEDEAAAALGRFLIASRSAGRRCVLVITGKGLHSDGAATLRHVVPELLGHRFASHVRGFAPARPVDGGSGALYVLLSPYGRSTT